MCWNYEVSLGFSVLYLVINTYYLFRKPPYWREYLMFGMFYFIMEAFQTAQWLYGNVYIPADQTNTLANHGTYMCDKTNMQFTVFAHILIWLQPILFSYIGYRTSNEINKRFLKYLLITDFVVFLYSLLMLYIGFYKYDYYSIDDSIFGLSTCTNQGRTGHLVWRFKPASIDYFPNYLMYLVMCMLAFFLYDKSQTKIIGYGWLASLVITKLVLRPSLLEIASSWCLLSIIANIMIFVYLQFKRNQ